MPALQPREFPNAYQGKFFNEQGISANFQAPLHRAYVLSFRRNATGSDQGACLEAERFRSL